MAFWESKLAEESSTQLSQLLSNPEVTLETVLDDDYLLSELQLQNESLLAFLMKSENIEKMVTLCLEVRNPITIKPHGKSTEDGPVPFDLKNKMHFSLASVSSEVLSANSEPLSTALVSNPKTSKMLAYFLSDKAKGTINPLVAAFYTKIIVSLTTRIPTKVLKMLENNANYVQGLVLHSDVSSLGPLIYAFVTAPTPDSVADAYKAWLVKGGLVDGLINALKGDYGEAENAGFLWTELVQMLRDLQYTKDEKTEDPLLSTLQDETNLRGVLNVMFASSASKEAILSGCSLFTLLLTSVYIPNNPSELEAQAGSNYGLRGGHPLSAQSSPSIQIWSPDPDHVIERVLADRVQHMTKFIVGQNAVREEDLQLPLGKLKAFGQARYCMVKLVAKMLEMNHPQIHEQILKHQTLKCLMEVCSSHPWNNLLHVSVSECMSAVLFSRLPGPQQPPQLDEEEEKKMDDISLEERTSRKMNVISDYTVDPPLIRHLLHDIQYLQYLSNNVQQKKETFKKLGTYIGHFYEMCNDVENARNKGPNKKLIDLILNEPDGPGCNWMEFLSSTLIPYQKLTEPYSVDMPRHDESSGALMDNEEDFELGAAPANVHSAHKNFVDFQTQQIVISLPEKYGLGMDTFLPDDSHINEENLSSGTDIDFGVAQLDVQAKAANSFEAMCSQKMTTQNWFGMGTSKTKSNDSLDFNSSDEENMDVDKKKSGQGDSDWADFSSAQGDNDAANDNWANFEQQNPEWLSPVCAGFAVSAGQNWQTQSNILISSPGSSPSKQKVEEEAKK